MQIWDGLHVNDPVSDSRTKLFENGCGKCTCRSTAVVRGSYVKQVIKCTHLVITVKG